MADTFIIFRIIEQTQQENDLNSCGGVTPLLSTGRSEAVGRQPHFGRGLQACSAVKPAPRQFDFAGWSLAGPKFLDWLSSNSCLQKFFVIGGQVLEQPYVLVTAHPCRCLCKSKAEKAARQLVEFGCQHSLVKPYPADLRPLIA